ncbi:hypothetical protein HAX54_017028 [Datura stramonium]|uniref:ABC1 atypical kinase-like domain-containing protein n=1 Tax=Datura stramonium TaxID=4076 RepID=A0ABS8S0Z5_DATST|nr:hypothetical protein [Datura stramonium]
MRGARRLEELCFRNGGIYIKLGQHLGQLEYLVPEEYVRIMRESMLNRCPHSSYDQVHEVVKKELGGAPDEIFDEFDPVPIASASLAQVHVARTHDGQKVAVKVQHTHMTDTAAADYATVELIVNTLHRFFPSFDYRLEIFSFSLEDFSVIFCIGYAWIYFSTFKNHLKSGAYITAPETVLHTKPAPFMAVFSYAGPNTITPQILMPDITAPGVDIIAAYSEAANPSEEDYDKRKTPFNMISGTSMSCPHVAGVAGLLKSLHPDWSPDSCLKIHYYDHSQNKRQHYESNA